MVEGRPEVEDVRPAKALEALRRISIVGDILIDELRTLIGFGGSEKRLGLPHSPLPQVQIHPFHLGTSLVLAIAAAYSRRIKGLLSGIMDESKIQQYVLLAKGARGRGLLDLISKATSEPGLFTFGELLDVPTIADVGDAPHAQSPHMRVRNTVGNSACNRFLGP